MKDAGMCIRHVGRDDSQLQILHELLRRGSSALYAEGNNAAGTVRHVLLCQVIVLVARKSRIIHPGYLFIRLQEFGRLHGVAAVHGHTAGQRLEAQIQKIGVHRRLDRAEIAHQLCCGLGDECAALSELLRVGDSVIGFIRSGETRELVRMGHPVEVSAVYDGAADRRVMSVHVLGGGVSHDITAPLDGTAVDGGGERIIHNQRNAVGVGCLRKPLNIEYGQRRIGDGLSEYCLGVRTEGRLQFLVAAVRIHEGKVNSHLFHGYVEEVVGAAVDGAGGYDMIAAVGYIEDCKEVGCLTGGGQHSGRTAFHGSDLCRHIIVGRILKSCVKVAGSLQVKEFSHIFAGVILECRTLNDRDHSGFPVLRRISRFDAFRLCSHMFSFPGRKDLAPRPT